MTESTHVFERLRIYFRQKYGKYGFPDNALIGDFLVSTMQVPMFFEYAAVNTSTEILILKLRNLKSSKRKYILFMKSFLLGVFVYSMLLIRMFATPGKVDKVHLVFSLTESQIRDLKDIRAFMSDSRFDIGYSAQDYIVIENRKSEQDYNEKTLLVRDCMYWLYINALSPVDRAACLRDVVFDIILSLFRGKHLRLFLLKQMVIDKHIFKHVARKKSILSLSTTQNHLQKLPSCFYFADGLSITRFMFWYSDNSWVFKQAQSQKLFDDSRYKRDFIDIHYCWGTEWLAYLESLHLKSKAYATQSILFYVNNVTKCNLPKKYDLLVFDVTPSAAIVGEYDFYSPLQLSNFYDGLNTAIARSSVPKSRVAIKNKRIVNHDLDAWVELNEAIMLDPNMDLYELIASARVVIGMPLVSPVRIAKELKIPCAYYYPDQFFTWDLPTSYSDIPLFREVSDLSNWISRSLRSHN